MLVQRSMLYIYHFVFERPDVVILPSKIGATEVKETGEKTLDEDITLIEFLSTKEIVFSSVE